MLNGDEKMRMRKKKNLIPRMEACADYLVSDPQQWKGRWHERFGHDGSIHLEIGCGKGKFITEMAQANPDTLFIAVERVESVLLLALEKAKALQLSNLLFLSTDAALLDEVFAADEIDRVYLNFSDPWPPKKQWKRRLSHRNMLKIYDGFLAPGGEIQMKTDNRGLFEFSLCEFSQFGYVLYDVTFDLHHTDTPNIMTEYETSFAEKGMNIYRCVARKQK